MLCGGHLNYYPLNRYWRKGGRRGERIWFNVDLLWAGACGRGRHHALSLEWLGFAMLVSRWSSKSIYTVFATPPARIEATEGLLYCTFALDICPTKVPNEDQTFSR